MNFGAKRGFLKSQFSRSFSLLLIRGKSADLRISFALVCQQRSFPGESPAISREIAIFANNAMARNHDGNRVRGASSGDCASCFWAADGARNLRIGSRGAVRNFLQLFPHATLKCCGLHIERKIELWLRSLEVMNYFADEISE